MAYYISLQKAFTSIKILSDLNCHLFM